MGLEGRQRCAKNSFTIIPPVSLLVLMSREKHYRMGTARGSESFAEIHAKVFSDSPFGSSSRGLHP